MPNILFVDDSPFDRELVKRILSQDPTLNVDVVESGKEALALLEKSDIDLVLTDLQMPDMDGLELVSHIRLRFSNVPVVLTTGLGSGDIAVLALERGAAHYVSKRILNEKLLDTIYDVLALSETEIVTDELVSSFTDLNFKLCLENKLELHEPLIGFIQRILTGMNFCDVTGGYQIGIALTQALSNALFRGNLEITLDQEEADRLISIDGIHTSHYESRRIQPPYSDRKTHLEISINQDEARFIIRDEGPGFDLDAQPDPENAGELESRPGRGFMLMYTLMDDVSFNESGNQVTMVKRRQEK